MAVAARRITVVVDGTSTELQQAIAKAAESLKGLGEVVAKQSRASVAAGESTIKSNREVVTSYQRVADGARSSSLIVVESYRSQMAAQREAVASQVLGSKEQEKAAQRVASTSTAAADAQVRAAGKSKAASVEAADAATASAKKQAGAADQTIAANRKAGDSAGARAAKSDAAFAASGGALTKLGRTTVLAAAATAAASLYMSANFDKAIMQFHTQAGIGIADTQKLGKNILKMSGEVGARPKELAAGMYHVVSSMNTLIPVTERVNVETGILREAMKGAAIGDSNRAETAYVLSSAMNSLGRHTIPLAAKTMAELNAIVGTGDMHMQDLVGAMSTGLLPSVATFHVSLHSVGAALAYMVDRGVPATNAATRLRMAITMMGAPTKMAAHLLRDVGLSSTEAVSRSKAMSEVLEKAGLNTTRMAHDLAQPDGLLVALRDLKQHMIEAGVTAQGQAALIARAFGGARSGTAIQMLFEHPEVLEQKFRQQQKVIHEYGSDWVATRHTLAFEARQMEGSIEALGITLGHDLTPAAETVLSDLRSVADWLGHNDAAAIALAGTIGGVLSVAVAAFTINRLAKLVQGLKQAQVASAWLRAGFTSPMAGGGATRAAGASAAGGIAGVEQQVQGHALIGGARSGLGLPGSVMNPIVVAIEAGQYAGLGGQAAEGTVLGASAGEKSAKVSQGIPAAGGVTAAERQAETAGVMSTVRSGVGTAIDRMFKGGLVAGLGVMGAQIAGSAIGGKTGKTVSSVGTDAALGAAIGTVIEPGIGTAIGAALGGIGGELHHLLGGTQGEHVAAAAAADTAPVVQQHLHAGIDNANKVAEKAIYSIEHEHADFSQKVSHWLHEHTFGIVAENGPDKNQNSAQRREVREANEAKQAQLFSVGKQFGVERIKEKFAAVAGMSSFAQITSVILDTEKRIGKLPEATRAGAFESIVAMVKEFQKDGKLPPTSVEELTHAMESKFPGLTRSFASVGADSIRALNGALKGQEVLSGVEGIVNQWSKVFPQLPYIVGLNLGNAVNVFQKVNGELLNLSRTGPASQRIAASEAYKKMHDEEINYFRTMRGGIESELKHLSHHVGPITKEGTVAMVTAYERMRVAIEGEMSAGVKATSKGTSQINSILKSELHALGMKTPSELNKAPGGAFGPQPGSGGSGSGSGILEGAMGGVGGFTGLGKARGGLIQFGRHGEAGRDSIPVNAGGVPIVVGRGEQIAVFNRHQQAVANAALAHMGGLPGLFRSVKTPNYMATGGFVAEPGTNFSVGKEPAIVADLRKLAAIMHTTIYGISGYRSPAHSVAVGGFSNDPHTRGEAADIGVGSPSLASAAALSAAILARVGLERPFYPASAHEINHVQLLGSMSGGGGARGTAAGAVATAVAAAVAKHIKTPRVPGHSVFSQIAQAALNQVAHAANQKLGNASAGTGSFAGVKGSGGAPGANEKLGRAMMLAAGWPPGEWPSLQALWTQESGWNANSVNPSSGVYGIPQALGHGHPFNLGDARAQIAWGLNYIRGRYGSPASAEAHERAFHWYSQGGLLLPEHFAGGGQPAKPVSRAAAAKVKNIIKRGKGTKPKLQKVRPTKASFAPLDKVAGLGDVPTLISPFEQALEALANQESLMEQMSSDPHGFFITPGDMQYITPTLQPGENIAAGMNVLDAQAVARAYIAAHGEENEGVKLQNEILSWIAGQASHRLLTGSDVSILAGTFKGSGLKFGPGSSLLGDEQTNLQSQLTWMGTKAGAKYTGTERGLLENIQIRLARGQAERHARNERIRKTQDAAYTRYKHIKEDIDRLTTGSLKDRVAAAKNAYYEKVRTFDADEHARHLRDAIAEERKAEHPDKPLIAEHEKALRAIHVPKPPSTRSITSAQVALMKDKLKKEITPIEATLHLLGGSSTSIGTGGEYGKNKSENQTIIGKASEVEGLLGTLVSSKIPATMMSLRSVQEAMTDSPVPIAVKAGEGVSNTALQQLLEQQNLALAANYAVSQAQFAVFKNFTGAGLPKYERGGVVRNTGLALVHEGEFIQPNPRGAWGSQLRTPLSGPGAPAPEFHHTTVVQGDIAPLISLIDSRVQHPDNLAEVSRHIARRSRGLPAFR